MALTGGVSGGERPADAVISRRFGWILLGIVIVALVIRVVFTVVVLDELEWPGGYGDTISELPVRSIDEAYYGNGARALADGDWFRYSVVWNTPVREQGLHPPLTNLMLAPVAAFGGSDLAFRLAGAVAGAATVGLIGLIGRRIGGAATGIVAACLAAVYPNMWMNDGLILSETWAMLAVAAVVLAALCVVDRPTPVRGALLGLACGAAMLARGELALLVPILGVYLLIALGACSWPKRFEVVAVLGISAGLVVAPWVVHNLVRFDETVLLSHGDGDVILGTNCPTTYHGDLIGLNDGACPLMPEVDPDSDPSVATHARREAGLEYARANLSRLPVVMTVRLGRVTSVYAPRQMATIQQLEGRPLWASYAGLTMYWALVVGAVVGAVALRRRRVPVFPLLAPIVVVVVNALLFFGFVRHRAPAEPSIVLLASVGFVTMWRAWRTSSSRVPVSGSVP